MSEPVNPSSQIPVSVPVAPHPATDPVVARILAASTGIGQLAQRPLGEIAEQLDALHGELQAALVDVDNSAKN